MRKWFLAFAGLLVSAGVCYSAYFQAQTYLPAASSRVQVAITSAPYNAVCDAQYMQRVVTITNSGSGLRDVAVTVNTFNPINDVNKTIYILSAGIAGNPYVGTIATVADPQHITLSSDASIALSANNTEIGFGTDNTAAFVAFKTAYQGATPVQLNMSGNCGYLGNGGSGKFPWAGIDDLIVAGNGSGTSAFVKLDGASLLAGGQGQYQDNSHSLRTMSANAGDSCVTVKTTPAVTVSAIGNSLPNPAVFTASASVTTLTVTAVASGTIAPGAYIGNQDSNTGGWISIQPYGTGGTTGVGGTGTYALSSAVATNFSSQIVITKPASFTASVATTGIMTVSAVQDGTLAVGMWVYSQGGGIAGNTTIKSQLTGAAGGTGTYQLDAPPQSSVSSGQFQGNGQPRVTLNSATGLTSGDTLYLTGITGRGQLPQRVNGLRWIKVVNSTQVDIFQGDYDGSYTSGGTGGGDRTSLTPPGTRVMMSGYLLQGYWATPYGYPGNNHWFEYKTVVSTNSTTHQVCFDTPLTNSYSDTWPQMNTGNLFEVDPGGPATLYALPATWDKTIEFRDFTLAAVGQNTANGRNITWRNVKMYGVNCAIPTQNVTHTWDNVDASTCSIETDKLVGTWTITGGSVRSVHVQSSSMNEITLNNTTVGTWYGSPKKLTINNSIISGPTISTDPAIKVGTDIYGASDESIFNNVSIGTGVISIGSGTGEGTATSLWSMSGGVITIPNAISYGNGTRELQTRFMVPGHYNLWAGKGNGSSVTAQMGRALKIVSMTQDTENTYVTTSEAGGFPAGVWTTNGLSLVAHPAPKLTASFTGAVDSANVFNGCPPQAPMYSCANFTYTGGATGGSVVGFGPTIWGVLDTFTFTNNVPYTNTGALGWTMTRFANQQVLKTDLTTTSFGATSMINTKLPSSGGGGMRTLTPSGVTGTQSLDNLSTPPTDSWFGTTTSPIFTANTPSDSPQVTMTLRTNQNLPP